MTATALGTRARLTRAMRCTRRRAWREHGVILPTSILVMFAILMLTIPVVNSAVQSNKYSNRQIAANQALATAEAGAQAAYHRLKSYVASGAKLETGVCFTKEPVAKESSGLCPGETGSVGADKYTYYVKPLNGALFNCTGGKVDREVDERCITATATVNGVTRRVQERMVAGKCRSRTTGA